MQFLWFDHEVLAAGSEVPFDESLKKLVPATSARKATNVCAPEGSVTFVHPGGYMSHWKTAIVNGAGYVVFVSSEPHALTDYGDRGFSLTRGIDEFSRSGDLEVFIQSCRSGAPMWGLLKQPELPPHTVALLLVEIARRQIGDASIGAMSFDRLLHGAEEECGRALPTEPSGRIQRLRQALGE